MHGDSDLRDFANHTRLFPLPGVVLLPHSVLPLHIFEPRYRQMTEHALASDRLITILQVDPAYDWSSPGEPRLAEFGCLGRIVSEERLPDGRFNMLLLGRKRVRIIRELEVPTLYRQAEVEILEDIEPTTPIGPTRRELIQLFRRCVPIDAELSSLLDKDLPLGILTDILTQGLALSPAMGQAFLTEPRSSARAEALAALLQQLDPLKPGWPTNRPSSPPFSLN